MATTHRIECIKKRSRESAHEKISHVGGRNPNGTQWKLTQEDAIAGMESGKWAFYVERAGSPRVSVVIEKSAHGHKYLKTTADGLLPNNLLSLPECP